jgi:PAS domain S-box-containing protein
VAKILVVDGQPVDRNRLTTVLVDDGHVVFEAGDGAEALLIAAAERPELIITNLVMPGMDGYQLVRELLAVPALASTKVIFYTASFVVDEARPLAAVSGVGAVLAKPAESKRLLGVVNEVLAAQAVPLEAPSEEFRREHVRALSAKLADEIRHLRTAETALEGSEARFRSLAESCPVGIFSLDVVGRVTYSNPRLREICGLAEMDGMSPPMWSELLHPDDRDRVVAGVARAGQAAGRYRDELRVVRPDAGVRWVVLQLTPLANGDGPNKHVGTVEDVTEIVEAQRRRHELEARLRSTERLESLGRLSAGIAHDFNNLIGAILNYAHCMSSDVAALAQSSSANPRLAQLAEDSAAVATAAESAADLTRQLLIFSRREVIHTEIIDANDVVTGAAKLLSRTLGEHVLLESRLDPDLWPILGDRGRLEQVVVNLVVNARDAIIETGAIAIRTENVEFNETAAALHPGRTPGRYSRITVYDDGPGMRPETVARAFEPFFTTKPEGIGTGLGLATVYGTVTQLGGYVAIYSERGQGTTVRVYLPAADGPLASAIPPIATAHIGHAEMILVVDDDRAMREVAARLLADSGYSVISTDSGAAALRILADSSTEIDLLLTDVVMPGMSGREAAGHAMRARPGLPVVFMSGYPDDLFGCRPVDGAPRVLEKPFTHQTLLRSVAVALGRNHEPNTSEGLPGG